MSASVPAERMKLLFIDDEEDLLRVMHRALEPHHDVVSATTAEEGIQRLERGEAFDAILCDQNLPLMSGASMLGLVRMRWPALAARFVLLTNDGLRARSLGCAVIPKPFSLSDIRRTLGRFASR